MRKIGGVIVFNLILVLLLFFLAEMAVRFFKPEVHPLGNDKRIFADSLYFESAGLIPNTSGQSCGATIHVDAFGFRKNSSGIDTTRDSWLFLGDSVTLGIGVPDDSTFAALVQSAIDSVNILNPSVIGYHNRDYWNVLRHFLADAQSRLHIKRVFLFWCLNDVYADIQDVQIPGGRLRSLFSDSLLRIKARSRLYLFLKNALFDRSKTIFLFDESFYRPENPEFAAAKKRLQQMAILCRQSGVAFTVVLLPYEYQLRPGVTNPFSPQRLMRQTLQTLGIPVFDPFADVKSAERNSRKFYLYGDGIHFSTCGHRQVAEALLTSGVLGTNIRLN